MARRARATFAGRVRPGLPARPDRRRERRDRERVRLDRPGRRPRRSSAGSPQAGPRTPRGRRRRPGGVRARGRRPRPRSGPRSCSGPPRSCGATASSWPAWEVYECGKPWREADGDVAEAIDFCEFYAREMIRLAEPRRTATSRARPTPSSGSPAGWRSSSRPGTSRWRSRPGMTVAALVAGNTVVLKPASSRP